MMMMMMNLHVKNKRFSFHYNALCNPRNYYGWTESKLYFKITISVTVKGPKTTSSNNNSEVCIHFFCIKILPVKLNSNQSIFNWKPSEEDIQFATGICITGLLYSVRYQVCMLTTIYIIIIIKITLLLYFSIKA